MESSIPLEYPDYKRFSRTGVDGRILETRVKDAPKIFSPISIHLAVNLGVERNGVGLNSGDLLDIAESTMRIPSDLVIDIHEIDNTRAVITARENLSEKVIKAGQEYKITRHDVSISVTSIEDASNDESVARRDRINTIVSSDPSVDSIYVTLPQTWVIPDPEFRPRTSCLPLYPGSFWLQFFKSCWGLVSGASIVFGMDGAGNVGLAVRFKEIKSARQCVLTLHDRYLVHPREGLGMMMPNIRMVRYANVTAKKSYGAAHSTTQQMVGFARPSPFVMSEAERAMQSANGYATGGKDVPMAVSEAFQKILERVEKLDRENQRLLSLLVEDTPETPDMDRERSPRASRREIPPSGLPPWRMPTS